MHPDFTGLLVHNLANKSLTPVAPTNAVGILIARIVVLSFFICLTAIVFELVEPPGFVVNIRMQQQFLRAIDQPKPPILSILPKLILQLSPHIESVVGRLFKNQLDAVWLQHVVGDALGPLGLLVASELIVWPKDCGDSSV